MITYELICESQIAKIKKSLIFTALLSMAALILRGTRQNNPSEIESFVLALALLYPPQTLKAEDMTMNATTTNTLLENINGFVAAVESTQNERVFHSSILSELPGAVIAAVTLIYVVSSLISLA